MIDVTSEKEILEKAIQKAIDNGWDVPLHLKQENNPRGWRVKVYNPTWEIIFNHNFAKALWPSKSVPVYNTHYIPARGYPGASVSREEQQRNALLYEGKRYDLPEAMFACVNCKKQWDKCFKSSCEQVAWAEEVQYKKHLQQMVIAENPIAYLGEHLTDEQRNRLEQEERV